MSWDEVGKQAKKAGVQIHRDRTHLDPVPPPPKLPGKSVSKPKGKKRFGFTYQCRFVYKNEQSNATRWRTETSGWYATARQRDDAIRSFKAGTAGYYEMRNMQPIERS